MGYIIELPIDIINKIAAGEVVERPASVIKELIENSIDANSSDIHIELVDAGKKKITIKDNGKGIDEDDVELAIKRHATSKIKTAEDLYSISTLGFRGEALSAIASVSKTSITSKSKEADYGIKLYTEYGNIISKKKTAISTGTTINVEEIYSNTPARLKFLKTNQTELTHCISTINNYALLYPNITFKLIHNGRSLFFYPSNPTHKNRINNVYSVNFKWLENSYQHQYISGKIFISVPNQNTKKDIKIFVNGRSISDRNIYHAINSSLEEFSLDGSACLVLVFLNIEPEFVDVNVSPTKDEVRFREQNIIYTFVKSMINQSFPAKQKKIPHQMPYSNFDFKSKADKVTQSSLNLLYGSNIQNNNEIVTKDNHEANLNNNVATNIIGQFNLQYILIEENNTLVLIDQHAAHERINFEKISTAIKENPEKQALLIPEMLELNIEDSNYLRSIIDNINQLGFEIEHFMDAGNKITFVIRAIPSIISDINANILFNKIIEDKHSDTSRQSIIKIISQNAARISCHASVRGKQKLSTIEIEELLKQLAHCQYPYTCPHGRPTKIEISLNEIEKMFLRK